VVFPCLWKTPVPTLTTRPTRVEFLAVTFPEPTMCTAALAPLTWQRSSTMSPLPVVWMAVVALTMWQLMRVMLHDPRDETAAPLTSM